MSRNLVGTLSSYNENASSTTIGLTRATIAAGSLIVVGVRWEDSGGVTATCADNVAGAYTHIATIGTNPTISMFYKHSHPGGTSVEIDATLSSAQSYRGIWVAELDGNSGFDPLDATAVASENDTDLTVTATAAGTLLGNFGWFSSSGSFAITSPGVELGDIWVYQGVGAAAVAGAGSANLQGTGASGNAYGIIANFKDSGTAPTAPTAGSATDVANTTATANWTDNSTGETGFPVETSPSPYSSWTSQGTASANSTSLSLTGLSQNTTYKFRVAATNGTQSAWSESPEFTTTGGAKGRSLLLGVG